MAGLALAVAGCQQRAAPPPKLTLKPAAFDQLAGWADDTEAGAIPALLKSCSAILAKADGAPLDDQVAHGDFGTVAEWRGPCAASARLPGTDSAAKAFFESEFVPVLVGNGDDSDGLFTGYFEIALDGSRRREGRYQIPLYRLPPQPDTHTRAQIEDGALAGKGLELLWVADPVAAYFLAVEGEGVIRLDGGGAIRVGYAGSNGQPFIAIGRLLIQRGLMPREKLTMQNLRDWIATHGDAGTALMREDPSYVFFQELAGPGPFGSENVVLTPGRSLAVDRRFIPLGVPIWLDAQERYVAGATRRLVIAQDTGGAIKGPVRGDLYWGGGAAAAAAAGAMDARGQYYVLLPKAVAARAVQAAGGD